MKDTLPSLFLAASAAIISFLGFIHLFYTYYGQNLRPRDSDLTARMMATPLFISPATTIWRCWIGFNASHSLCLIFFGAIYAYLAIRHRDLLFHSWFLLALGFALLLSYTLLSKLYFFYVPFLGVSLASLFYLLGIVVYFA